MRKALLWLGGLLVAAGGVVVATSVIVTAKDGLTPSLNLGDPSQFQFILVPLWAIGLALAVVGALCLLGWRRMKTA